jgi:SnoaL-like domain
MADGPLGDFIRDFIGRVVNAHDVGAIDQAVDQLVSPDYVGTGPEWHHLAPDFDALRAFYHRQAIQRPDWRIDIQETIEVGEYVAVRALAGGTQALDEDGAPRPPFPTGVEWMSVTHVVDGKIVEGHVVTSVVTSHA